MAQKDAERYRLSVVFASKLLAELQSYFQNHKSPNPEDSELFSVISSAIERLSVFGEIVENAEKIPE